VLPTLNWFILGDYWSILGVTRHVFDVPHAGEAPVGQAGGAGGGSWASPCSALVHTGLYWSILVCTGLYWGLLVTCLTSPMVVKPLRVRLGALGADPGPVPALYWSILLCTGLYWSILVYWRLLVTYLTSSMVEKPLWVMLGAVPGPVPGLYWSILVYTGLYWRLLVMYVMSLTLVKPLRVRLGALGADPGPVPALYWSILVYTGLYWFILVCTGGYWSRI